MAFPEEIAEQGKALRDLTAFYRAEGCELLSLVTQFVPQRLRSIVLTGMGSSAFVHEVANVYLGDRSPYPVVVWDAGELFYYGIETIRDHDLIIAVSQSGESVETRKIVQALRDHKYVISVTNNAESTMARLSSLNLPMCAGSEESISNKTYTNSIALMLLISRAITVEDCEPLLNSFEEISAEMDEFVASRRSEIAAAGKMLFNANCLHVISRGPSMTAAKQTALTFQEGTHVLCSALTGGAMRHGPFEIVGPGHHAMVFAPAEPGGDLLVNMALEMAELGSKVVLFTGIDSPNHPNMTAIRLPSVSSDLFPLVCAVPQELLLERMALDRGLTPGLFIRGSKITVKE